MAEFDDGEDAAQDPRSSGARDPWEKSWEEAWKTDRLDAVGWAALFIWGALVVLATNTSFQDDFSWWDGWGGASSLGPA